MEAILTNQAILAIFPLVAMGIITGILGLYFAGKERRESRKEQAKRNESFLLASLAASSTACTMLSGSATPLPAISKAVP